MNATRMPDLIRKFYGMRVAVIGDAMLDRYFKGTADKICREAPVPIVQLAEWKDAPGGAANTAANLAALGAQVQFLSVIGDDPEGNILRDCLRDNNVSTDHLLIQRGRKTLAKQRILAASQIVVRFDQGNTEPISKELEETLIEGVRNLFPRVAALVVSDYCYGILTPSVIEAIARLQAESPRVIVVDSRLPHFYRNVGVTAVKPNYAETCHLLGMSEYIGGTRAGRMISHGNRILELTGARMAAVTLDSEGAILFERDKPPYRTYTKPTADSKAAGAGDTFSSALCLALAADSNGPSAAEIAAAAAEIVVGKEGTSRCSHQELLDYFHAGGKLVEDRSRVHSRIDFFRKEGMRIVFTNGCFDILHRGHITYLSRAKALGDVLVVGVNSDESIRRLKGPARPINRLEDRVEVLAALSCVDLLVPFSENTPEEILKIIQPDIFVKGGDYTRETLPEAGLIETQGGQIEILPYLEDRSTTGIIERIRGGYPPPDNDSSETAARNQLLQFTRQSRTAPAEWSNLHEWRGARKILCVRLDTIGDVLMTTPALRAIKESQPGTNLTLLTSPAGSLTRAIIPEIDSVITYDAPWLKATTMRSGPQPDFEMIDCLRQQHFDAAIVFTVYSQNPLPSAFLCYLAGISLRLAHCHENPYQLLTNWIRDPEPEQEVRHEVQRQLDLVRSVGFNTQNERISVHVPANSLEHAKALLHSEALDDQHPTIVIHPGATAASRRYPPELFAVAARAIAQEGFQVVFTGTEWERELINTIQEQMKCPSRMLLHLDLATFAAVISLTDIVLANNTSAVHIAAGTGTPVVDLYALTNPQHIPWQVPNRVLSHDVPCKYCYSSACPEQHHDCLRLISPNKVVQAVLELFGQTQRRQSHWRTMAGVGE